jgi:hypothetical protein
MEHSDIKLADYDSKDRASAHRQAHSDDAAEVADAQRLAGVAAEELA